MTLKELRTLLARIIKFLSALPFLWEADEKAVATSLRRVASDCHALANRIDDPGVASPAATGQKKGQS